MTGRLVALHGFTQTHHHVDGFALRLARRVGFDAITCPDLPGHGLSTDDRADFAGGVTSLAHLCGTGTYLGYSMGGRFALGVATSTPHLVRRLVLISATAGIEDADEAAARRRDDARRADGLATAGLDRFLDDWLAMPMFARLPVDPRDRLLRRRNTADGLAHSLRTAGTGSMPSLWGQLSRITAPTLVLAGRHDTKFVDLGRRLAATIPNATFTAIDDAGHAAHLERPDDTLAVIADWIARAPGD